MADHRELRQLGTTDVELTALGLGTAGLGGLFDPVDDIDAQATIDSAWASGCRYFDTSPFYGHGQSEIRTGRGLYRHDRASFSVSTKVGRLFRRPADAANFTPDGWAGGLPFELHFDYTYDGIMRSVEDSYLRLGITQIDVLFIHDLDAQFHADPAELERHRTDLLTSGWMALEQLKADGTVQAIGAGLNDRPTMRWFLDHVPVDAFLLALRYTLLENDVLDDELAQCLTDGVGVVIGGAFNSGILASGAVPGAKYNYGDAPVEVVDRVNRIAAVCDQHDTPMVAAALQFPAAHPATASVIPGALNAEHVEANIAAFGFPIPPQLWSDLKNEGLLRDDAPTPTPQPTTNKDR
ncbi:MAG: aldo/keto reductase [Ilumatobacteraceae bacterium]